VEPSAAQRLSAEDQQELQTLVSGKTPQQVAQRARFVLGAAVGIARKR
jgi:hypothetical protein